MAANFSKVNETSHNDDTDVLNWLNIFVLFVIIENCVSTKKIEKKYHRYFLEYFIFEITIFIHSIISIRSWI